MLRRGVRRRRRVKRVLPINVRPFNVPFAELPYAAQSKKAAPKFRAHYVVQNGIDRRIYVEHDSREVQQVVVALEADFHYGFRRDDYYP